MNDDRNSSALPVKDRGVLYYVGLGLSGGLLAFVALLGILVIVVPAATGSTPMTVLTSSMEPTYPPGTLVIVSPIETRQIRVGDSITYQIKSNEAPVVTHRVVSIMSSSDGRTTFVTKGDNNSAADAAPVIPEQVRGKVWYSVPWIGYLNNLVTGDVRGWIVPAVAAGLFLYAGYMIAGGLASGAKKRRLAREQERQRREARADEVFGRVTAGSAATD